jgi:dihydroorotate dehydrogenase
LEQLRQLADKLLEHKVDGVIATNTTVSRPNVVGMRYADEAGGLSGQPLNEISTAIVGQLYELLADNIPIIACGGILSARDALEKFKAGARLVQIYTGFVYRGPHLIQEIVSAYIQEILS